MVTLADRVEQESDSTGTGAVNLGAVPDARVGFVGGAGDGATVPYVIEDGNGTAWEVGRGTVTAGSPDTLSRDNVIASTASGGFVSLSSNTPHKVMLVTDTAFLNTLVSDSRTLTGGDGIQTIGDLSADRTVAVDGTVVRSADLTANNVSYDNTQTDLDATNVQSGVNALDSRVKFNKQTEDTSSLDLNFATDIYKVDDGETTESRNATDLLTVNRASTKMVQGPNGLLREVPANTIAREWKDGKCQGALIEEQRTNLLTYSEDFGNSVWNVNSSLTSSVGKVSPAGNYTKYTLSNGSYSPLIFQTTPNVVATGTRTTLSVYVSDETDVPYLVFNVGNSTRVNVDLINEILNEDNSSPASTLTVERCLNGRRISVSATTQSDENRFGVFAKGAITTAYSSPWDGGEVMSVDAMSLEIGSTPSSYIPTTTSQVTRAADEVSRTLGGEFNESEGTIFIDTGNIVPNSNSDFGFVYRLDDGTNDNRIYGIRRRSGGYSTYVFSGGTNQDEFINANFGDNPKIAVSWKDGGQTLTFFDGVQRNSGSNISAPVGLTHAAIGGGTPIGGGSGIGSQETIAFQYYPYAMTQQELEELTK